MSSLALFYYSYYFFSIIIGVKPISKIYYNNFTDSSVKLEWKKPYIKSGRQPLLSYLVSIDQGKFVEQTEDFMVFPMSFNETKSYNVQVCFSV